MQSKNQQSDDFGTFLQSVQRAVRADEELKSSSTLRIMSMLSKMGEVEVVQLMTVVEMQWDDFSQGVNSLQSAGLVQVADSGKSGKIQLTNDGMNWVNALEASNDRDE